MRAATLLVSRHHVVRMAGLLLLLSSLHATGMAQTSPEFEVPTLYTTPVHPAGVDVADFNGDGCLDLVVTFIGSAGEGGFSVLPGKCDGTFGERADHRVRIGPSAVAVGEVTGDARTDLVLVGSGAFAVYRGLPRGRFAGGAEFSTPEGPAQVALGDFDGDGWSDLAISDFRQNNLGIYLAKGHGQFESPVFYPGRNGPYSITTADFDDDGDLDVAVGNLYPDYVPRESPISVFLGNGDGTFGPRVDTYVGQDPEGIVAADFNEDGTVDLAAANAESRTLSILLGDGAGAFPVRKDYPTGDLPFGLAVADFNRDGHFDAVVSNHQDNTLSIFLGAGDGNFMKGGDYAAGGGWILDPADLVATDFNGDGWADIAVTNIVSNTVAVHLNRGSEVPAASTRYQPGRSQGAIGALTFTTRKPGWVAVNLYDVRGRLVQRFDEFMPAGAHSISIDGRDDAGGGLASGVYYYKVESGEGAVSGRVVVLK